MNKQTLNNAIIAFIIAIICFIFLVYFNTGCTMTIEPQIASPEESYSRINDNETRIISGVEFFFWGEYNALQYNYIDSTLAIYGPFQVNPEPFTEYDNMIKFKTGEVTEEYIQIIVLN